MTDWNKWAAVGQLGGAAATFLAVITSLFLARRETRPRARTTATILIETSGSDPALWPRDVGFHIQNIGQRPLHVSTIGWRTGTWPFKRPLSLKKQYAFIPMWDSNYPGSPPFDVQPYRKALAMLRLDDVVDGIVGMSGEPFFARKWPLLGLRPTTIFAVFQLEEGRAIKARVSQDLKRELFQAEVKRAANQARTTEQPGG